MKLYKLPPILGQAPYMIIMLAGRPILSTTLVNTTVAWDEATYDRTAKASHYVESSLGNRNRGWIKNHQMLVTSS